MRNSLQCPKCQHRKIWHIEEVRHDNPNDSGGTPFRVVFAKRVGPIETGFFSDGERKMMIFGHYDVFICSACGYAEWYAQDFQGLEENPEDGVRLLDGETQGGAYR